VRAGREVGDAVLGRAREDGPDGGRATRQAGGPGRQAGESLDDVVPFDELLADVEGRSDASRSSRRATLGNETDP
jgi:hypothetical protein